MLSSWQGLRPGGLAPCCWDAPTRAAKSRISPSPEAVSLLVNTAGLSREEILRKQTPLFFSQRFRTENPKAIEEHYRMQLLAPVQPEYAFQAQLRAIYLFDCTDALAKISNPALVVTGTEDVLIPPANSIYLAEHLPKAELIANTRSGACFACRMPGYSQSGRPPFLSEISRFLLLKVEPEESFYFC